MNNIILNFYGLSHFPFMKDIPTNKLYLSASHKQTLGFLELGIQADDIMVLSGDIGVGKSAAIRNFCMNIDADTFQPIYIRGTKLSGTDLYKIILDSLQISPPHFGDKAKRLYFSKVPELVKKPIIIIDDAQELKDSALLEIKSMVNFECDSKNSITFLLTGQPELMQRLKFAHFYSLRQRIKMHLEMKPLTVKETCEYIDHHTKICNKPTPIFSDDAKMAVFKRSKGIARVINSICYNAIAYGAANKCEIIDSSNLLSSPLLED